MLDFHGDIKATEVSSNCGRNQYAIHGLRKLKMKSLCVLNPQVAWYNAYGLACGQLARIKEAGLRLTVCIDKVAASGGYMMACVADKILAAPFAVVGSIGVVAQVPNFHDLLEKHDIDVEAFTAGKYKRTVTVLVKIPKKTNKNSKELEETHKLFKDFVRKYRPSLDVEQVATGEHWFWRCDNGNLVDALQTSDSYILEKWQITNWHAIQSRQKPTSRKARHLASGTSGGSDSDW